MTALLLFLMLHIFAMGAFIYRNKLIDGMQANTKVKAVRALAHWENMILEAKTAHEKMVYLRMADEVRATIINDMKLEIADSPSIESIDYSQYKATSEEGSKVEVQEAANVVSLTERRKKVGESK